jgi:hypothetical protein
LYNRPAARTARSRVIKDRRIPSFEYLWLRN